MVSSSFFPQRYPSSLQSISSASLNKRLYRRLVSGSAYYDCGECLCPVRLFTFSNMTACIVTPMSFSLGLRLCIRVWFSFVGYDPLICHCFGGEILHGPSMSLMLFKTWLSTLVLCSELQGPRPTLNRETLLHPVKITY